MDTSHTGALLPRSASLAVWLPYLAEPVAADALAGALHAVCGDDEPHTVQLSADVEGSGGVPLESLAASWAHRLVDVTAAFPIPGDVAGVPGEISGTAMDAEECVLVMLRAAHPLQAEHGEAAELEPWALVPLITEFGSVFERGHLVAWQAVRVPDWRLAVISSSGDLRDAERHLRATLAQATEALIDLDVASWSDDVRELLAGLSGYRALADLAPESFPQQRARVLSESARLRFIVEAATRDDGGAVNLWQSDQRSAALRHIDHVARHAMAAATRWTLGMPLS